ncbi:SCO family protein [Profundibacterium mesophilum]
MHVKRLILAAGLAMSLAPPAAADHPGAHLDREMFEKETYFQPADHETAPGFALVDAQGTPVSLDELRGKIVILNFIYASCPDFCPLHSQKIADVQELINASAMKDMVEFVSITTDPEEDTPEVLAGYGELHGLDGANWRILTAGPDDAADVTRELARAYGVDFMTSEMSDEMMHGVVTFVIDQEGELAGRFHGLAFTDTNLVLYVNGLINNAQHAAGKAEQGGLKGWLGGLVGN